MKNLNGSVPIKSPDRRTVLDRILDIPSLDQVVPRLQPDLLHRVIQSCGLEDCGELVALATPEQLMRIFDLDLWRSAQPGMTEEFDAERFGLWLEVLAEFGASPAAQKLAQIDADLVIAGLAQHARVFDCAVVTPYRTTDGMEMTGIRETGDGLECEVGGYRLVAARADSWDAIVSILISLDSEHPEYFHQVMRGCRALSNASFELDGLDDVLGDNDQAMFDLAIGREQRRDKQGYVTPVQARAFLEMSRKLQLGSDSVPPASPIARAYLRLLDRKTKAQAAPPRSAGSKETATFEEPAAAVAAFVDVLLEAGIVAQPRALLNGSRDPAANLHYIRRHMRFVFDSDSAAYARRNEELTYLANTIVAGCAVQGRQLTAQEASDAVVAVCNLGLENWPAQWSNAKSMADNFLVDHDLVTVFQVGWTVLHKDVGLYAAEQLLGVLDGLRCHDRDIQTGLAALRIQLKKCCRAGMPWRARDALDVIAMLDMLAWTALLGLIAECPVLPAALSAWQDSRTHSVSASAFDFISENRQITAIRDFIYSLPEVLRP